MRRLILSVFTALFACALLITTVRADIREGTYEVQGVCFNHVDPVFPDALGGIFAPDSVTNARPHIHMQWLINDGVIESPADMLGKCYVIFSEWVKDSNGAVHQNAYIPKGEMSLREMTANDAFTFANVIKDGYIEDQDIEAAREKGLGSSGSTATHMGHRTGSE